MIVLTRWSSALFAALMLLTVSAKADVAVLRPLPESPAPSPADVAAYDAVLEALAAANIQTISSEEAKARLFEAAQNPCLDVDCAGSVLRALGADMLVAVAIGETDGQLVDVVVGLVDADGVYVNAEAPIENGDVARAARAAIVHALTKWPLRGRIPLEIDGSPAGAMVIVDGQPRGVLPLEVRVQPGEHTITVSHESRKVERRIEVSAAPGETLRVRIDLDPNDEKRARRQIIGGSILTGAGLGVALGSVIYALTGDACHLSAPDGTCVEAKERQTTPFAIWLSSGTAAAAAGAAWLGVGVYRLRHAQTGNVDLAVGLGGLSIKGKF